MVACIEHAWLPGPQTTRALRALQRTGVPMLATSCNVEPQEDMLVSHGWRGSSEFKLAGIVDEEGCQANEVTSL